MKIFKIFIVWLITTVVMTVSWGLGGAFGNLITGTSPADPPENSNAALIFLAVCAVNSALIVALVMTTQKYSGFIRWVSLVLFVFGLQFALTQLETLFFLNSFPMTAEDILAILISGLVMSLATVTLCLISVNRMFRRKDLRNNFRFTDIPVTKESIVSSVLLAAFLYPLLYLLFGYFVAWQNTSLRLFYSGPETIQPFPTQLVDFVVSGIYAFQVFRGILWILITIPIICMMQNSRMYSLVIGILTAALPASLLFIPNPYMPEEIAMVHFVETFSSNFLWGAILSWLLGRTLLFRQSPVL